LTEDTRDAAAAAADDDRVLLPAEEACMRMGISRRTLRRAELRREIVLIKLGNTKYVTPAELARFIAQAEHQARARAV
jgi:hypothetical protein